MENVTVGNVSIAAGAALLTGLGWLAQPVQLPLGALLVLTFVPADTLATIAAERLQGGS